MFMWRTAQALAKPGNHEETMWVVDLGRSRKYLPKPSLLHSQNQVGQSLGRRKATLSERESGRQVDADSFLVGDRVLYGFIRSRMRPTFTRVAMRVVERADRVERIDNEPVGTLPTLSSCTLLFNRDARQCYDVRPEE